MGRTKAEAPVSFPGALQEPQEPTRGLLLWGSLSLESPVFLQTYCAPRPGSQRQAPPLHERGPWRAVGLKSHTQPLVLVSC